MNPIKRILKDLGDNDGWYNARKIMRYFDDTLIFWILGERRIGKTDLFLRVACELFIRYRKQTMWIRNKKVELEDPAFLADFLNDAKRLGWCPEEWDTRAEGVFESSAKDAAQIIKFQSISTFSNRRGGAHPDVLMMVLDEMMPEDRRYPRMAPEGLASLSKTVFSGNVQGRIFCLSNYVSAANPYFVRFRIYPSSEDVTVFRDKRMLIERCRGYKRAIEDGNPWNDVYSAAKMGNYASEEEDSLITLISKVPRGSQPAPYLFLIDGIYYREYRKNGVSYYDEYHGRRDGIVIFTPNLKECSDSVQLIIPYIPKGINESMQWGKVRFKNPNIMFAILSMVYDAV